MDQRTGSMCVSVLFFAVWLTWEERRGQEDVKREVGVQKATRVGGS